MSTDLRTLQIIILQHTCRILCLRQPLPGNCFQPCRFLSFRMSLPAGDCLATCHGCNWLVTAAQLRLTHCTTSAQTQYKTSLPTVLHYGFMRLLPRKRFYRAITTQRPFLQTSLFWLFSCHVAIYTTWFNIKETANFAHRVYFCVSYDSRNEERLLS